MPSKDIVEFGDRKECLSVVESIKIRKLEFAEMELSLNEIM